MTKFAKSKHTKFWTICAQIAPVAGSPSVAGWGNLRTSGGRTIGRPLLVLPDWLRNSPISQFTIGGSSENTTLLEAEVEGSCVEGNVLLRSDQRRNTSLPYAIKGGFASVAKLSI